MKNFNDIYYFTSLDIKPELTLVQKTRLHQTVEELFSTAISYVLAAIQYSNDVAGVAPKDFWLGLFEPTGQTSSGADLLLIERNKFKPYPVPAKPYEELDASTCLKYLYFGKKRAKCKHQDNFWKLFFAPSKIKEYEDVLNKGIAIRNAIAHEAVEDKVNPEQITFVRNRAVEIEPWSIPFILDIIEKLVSPLCHVQWDINKRSRCQEFVEGLWNRIYMTAGEISYDVNKLLDFVRIPRDERSKVLGYFKRVGIRVDGRYVYIMGDVADVAYALYFAYMASSKKRADLFDSLYQSIMVKISKAQEQEPDWDSLTFSELEAASQDSGHSPMFIAKAKYHIGLRYKEGRGVTASPQKARQLFYEAAHEDYAPAQVELGRCYETGFGITVYGLVSDFGERRIPKFEEAFKWYSRAASHSDAMGFYHLGRCYQYGIGTSVDHEEAAVCYMSAKDKGYREAEVADMLLRIRTHMALNIRDEESLEQCVSAQEYFAPLLDLPSAKTALGICCAHGWRTAPDINQAVELYRQASSEGDGQATYLLSQCYLHGNGVRVDMGAYADLLELSAQQNYAEAVMDLYFSTVSRDFKRVSSHPHAKWKQVQDQLGFMHDDPPEKMQREFFELVQSLMDDEYLPAISMMAYCYGQGIGTFGCKPNREAAIHYYKIAADLGVLDAVEFCANAMYNDSLNGGDESDPKVKRYAVNSARPWYEKAARCGSAEALRWLIQNGVDADYWKQYAPYLDLD